MARQMLWLALFGLVLLNSEPTESNQFYVGDFQGWTYGVENWPANKIFHAQNTLGESSFSHLIPLYYYCQFARVLRVREFKYISNIYRNIPDDAVFKYAAGVHNVVRVNKHGYQSCSPNTNAQTFSSGEDYIKLDKGNNYFICSMVGHCKAGMRLAIKAL